MFFFLIFVVRQQVFKLQSQFLLQHLVFQFLSFLAEEVYMKLIRLVTAVQSNSEHAAGVSNWFEKELTNSKH